MNTLCVFCVVAALGLGIGGALAQEPAPEADPGAPAAADEVTRWPFQIGVDLAGGVPQGGADFVGGVNAALLYPVREWLWVGLRPALHLVRPTDSKFEVGWFHPDLAVEIAFMEEPVRLYFLAAGGYAIAQDNDLYGGLATGWSALGAIGVSYRPDGPWGLFAELGFRVGAASKDTTVLDLDADGNPQCVDVDECLSYQTKAATRDFKLAALTLNLGVVYFP